jgi:hypothetical protein
MIPNVKMTFTDDKVGNSYPNDAVYNALVMGDKLFARMDSLSAEIKTCDLKLINTKQGYPACTTLKLNESTAITSDVGTARIMSEIGISVTLIENGDITLPPYEYGFVGGASGVYKDTVFFLGDVMTHRDKDKILSAISLAGMKARSLSDEPLCDLGGIIFICNNV